VNAKAFLPVYKCVNHHFRPAMNVDKLLETCLHSPIKGC